jgi:hypothetical protein
MFNFLLVVIVTVLAIEGFKWRCCSRHDGPPIFINDKLIIGSLYTNTYAILIIMSYLLLVALWFLILVELLLELLFLVGDGCFIGKFFLGLLLYVGLYFIFLFFLELVFNMAISNFRHDKIPSFHSDGVIVAICWIIA